MSQNVNVNLVPGNYPKEFHVSQYDVGRQLVANIVDSTGAYSIPSGATVTLVGTKPSGFGFTLTGSVGAGGVVTFSTTATVTAEYGRIPCELRITSGSTILGTANCMLIVEESPHPEGTTDGDGEQIIPELTLLVQRVEAAAESIHDLSVSATTLPAGSAATATYDEEENSIAFGIPRGADGEVSQAELDAAVSDLKSELIQISDNELSDSFTKAEGASTVIYTHRYNFIVGHTYRFTNTSGAGSSMNASTRATENGSNLETIATGLIEDVWVEFTPTQNANYLRVVANKSGSFSIYDKIGVQHEIANLKVDKANSADIKNNIAETVNANVGETIGYFKYTVRAGKRYKISNVSDVDYGLSIYSRIQPHGTNVEAMCVSIYKGQTVEFTATQNTDWVMAVGSNGLAKFSIIEIGTVDYRLDLLETEDDATVTGMTSPNLHNPETDTYGKIISPSGAITDSLSYYITDFIYVGAGNTISCNLWDGTATGKGFQAIALYDKNKNFVRRREPYMWGGTPQYTLQRTEVYARYNIGLKSGDEIMINLGDTLLDYVPYGELIYSDNITDAIDVTKSLTSAPIVKFDADYVFKDVSSVIESMDWSHTWQQSNVLEQVYALYDGLVASYPSYVSKVDVAEELGIAYPPYANGNYDSTPAYKTYMYKFIFQDTGIGTAKHKKKMLIVSGVHGNEIAAPTNTFLFAKQLCDGFIDDPNFYKLRSAFDFYIIPCLNGYGMYNLTRGNANGVNINRNFPTWEWYKHSEDTKTSATGSEWTGESAGSEFETQLIIGITDLIQPDMAIDHHNYSVLEKQFYTEQCNEKLLPLVYECLVDCSYAFKKNLPSYFGAGFTLLTSGEAPAETPKIYNATLNRWWFEQGIKFATTLEVSECINFVNGVYTPNTRNDDFGNNAFAVAEYTFRNQVLHYGQWLLDNYPS